MSREAGSDCQEIRRLGQLDLPPVPGGHCQRGQGFHQARAPASSQCGHSRYESPRLELPCLQVCLFCRPQRARVAYCQHCLGGCWRPGGWYLHHHQRGRAAVQGGPQQGQHHGGGGRGAAGEAAGVQGHLGSSPPVHRPVHGAALSSWSSQLEPTSPGGQRTAGSIPSGET